MTHDTAADAPPPPPPPPPPPRRAASCTKGWPGVEWARKSQPSPSPPRQGVREAQPTEDKASQDTGVRSLVGRAAPSMEWNHQPRMAVDEGRNAQGLREATRCSQTHSLRCGRQAGRTDGRTNGWAPGSDDVRHCGHASSISLSRGSAYPVLKCLLGGGEFVQLIDLYLSIK